MTISAHVRDTLLALLTIAKEQPSKVDEAIAFINEQPDPIKQMIDSMNKQNNERRSKYYRLIRPGVDTGWLITGQNADSNAKSYAARHGFTAANSSYYFVKDDYEEESLRTSTSATSRWGPLGVSARQPSFSGQFSLPDELQDFKPIR